ncbi:hypothetical protein ANAEL_04796 [Anaerolineales bacterium]|nr:hypothetical protein ANAEL_04796 [Anaerolineales bacterium]
MSILSFNGKTYNSLEEMPADQRAAYEQVMAFMKDENNNGVPDLFEGDVIQKMIGLAANTRIVVNGQEMRGLEALPPETREKFDKAMQILDRLGILPSGTQGTSFQSAPQISASEPAFAKSPSIIQSTPSAISEDTGSRTAFILLAVLGILVLCAAVAAAGFFFLMR